MYEQDLLAFDILKGHDLLLDAGLVAFRTRTKFCLLEEDEAESVLEGLVPYLCHLAGMDLVWLRIFSHCLPETFARLLEPRGMQSALTDIQQW